MLAFVKGILSEVGEGYIVVDVMGVGYELNVSTTTLSNVGRVGDSVFVHTYLQVREDGVTLFGFSLKEEKDLFLKLITVSGVGPKLALSVLSGMPLTDIIVSIASSDLTSLSRIKGLGKKTAEKIIVELREKVGGTDSALLDQQVIATKVDNELLADGINALISLGFNRRESEAAVKGAIADGADSLERVIEVALKRSTR